MKAILSIVLSLGLAFVIYLIFLHGASPNGGSPKTIISTTTVQMRLVNLAQAERLYYVQNSSYATLDQLSSSGSFTLRTPDPDGYSYSVDVSPSGFTATAQHLSASGQPDNFPVFSIDQSMQVHREDPQAGGAQAGSATSGGNDKPDENPGLAPGSVPSLPAGITGDALTPAPAPQN